MILKELDPFLGGDKFQIAGRKAEEQMAFYLYRYFGKSKEVHVINGLRLGLNNNAIQIDHLVVHNGGLVIVETKSVTGKIIIADDGQWIREFSGIQNGMRSPIVQAELQAMVLQRFFDDTDSYLKEFQKFPIKILISISDAGMIEWRNVQPLPGVLKADQICSKIKQAIESNETKDKIISYDEVKIWLEKYKAIDPERNLDAFLSLYRHDYLRAWRYRIHDWIPSYLLAFHNAYLNLRNNQFPEIVVNYVKATYGIVDETSSLKDEAVKQSVEDLMLTLIKINFVTQEIEDYKAMASAQLKILRRQTLKDGWVPPMRQRKRAQ